MKHAIKFIYVAAFLLILVLPLLFLNTKANAVSEVDNRTLVEMPEWTNQNFSQNFESYLKDRVGFRNEMINAYAVLNDSVVGELTHPIYTYGKDGYIFFGMHQNVEYSDFMRAFADMVFKMQEYCESRGSNFYFMFEPEKISVLRDYLPEGVNYNDDWVDELFSYLSDLGVNCINNTQILSEKEKDEDVFNKQYDAGHWNDLGCFYATNQLFERMHEDYPSVTPMDKSEFTITEKKETQLPVSQFQIEEQVPNFLPNASYTDVSFEYSEEVKVHDSYRHFHYYINDEENAKALPKVLMFQGSYYNGNGRSKFVTSRTSEYIGVHNYQNVLDLDYYYNIFQPDAVVFEVAEYTFSNLYFDYQKMCDLEFNPSLTDETDENSTIAEAVDNSVQFEEELLVGISEGAAVDKISIDKQFSDAEYVYLIIDGKAYDLSRNENNKLEANLLHDVLNESDHLTVFLKGIDGKQYGIQTTAYVIKEFDGEPITSQNIAIQAEEAIMTTNLEGNTFSSVRWQLIDGVSGSYLETLSETQSVGEISSSYVHNRESGWYVLRLKGNSHIQDEYIDYPVYLVRGKEYNCSCEVEELLPNRITLRNVSISGFFPKKDQN